MDACFSQFPTRVHVNNLSCYRKRLCEEFSGKWNYHLVFIKLIATADVFCFFSQAQPRWNEAMLVDLRW